MLNLATMTRPIWIIFKGHSSQLLGTWIHINAKDDNTPTTPKNCPALFLLIKGITIIANMAETISEPLMRTWLREGLKPISSTITLWAMYSRSMKRVSTQKVTEAFLMEGNRKTSIGLMFFFFYWIFFYASMDILTSSFSNSSGHPLTLAMKLRLSWASSSVHYLRR